MNAFLAIYLREMLILKRRVKKQIGAIAVPPLLYMLTFGYILGEGGQLDMGGHSYLEFLVPGLIAMTSMTQAFSISGDINVSRFYFFTFEEIQASPASPLAYIAGEICSGLTRVFIGTLVVIILGAIFGVKLNYGLYFWVAIALNGLTFASLGATLAMMIKNHADQTLLTSFVITPMAFLGGTFYPVESLPQWAQTILMALPLTHASSVIRADALGGAPQLSSLLVLLATGILFTCLAVYTVGKAKD